MNFLYRILTTTVILMGIVVLSHRSALADVRQAYAAVVCKGDKALVRLTMAWNDAQPDFTRPDTPGVQAGEWALMASKPVDRELDQLVPIDPSRCVLQDGRTVVLRQDSLGDAAAYGQCGGDTTEIFSLWVGGKKIYSREKWHPKCGFPSEVTEILVDGDHLTECRAAHESLFADAQPATCTDQSRRLSMPLTDDRDDGKVVLVRSAPDRDEFCRSLIRPWVPTTASWPTYPHDGLEKVDYPGLSQLDRVDLDNAGKISRVASWEGWWGGPNGNESLLAVFPDNQHLASDDSGAADRQQAAPPSRRPFRRRGHVDTVGSAVQSVENDLAYAGEEKVNALRKSGIIVFAGDQTLYHSIYGVHLTPFVSEGTTWIHASTIGRDRSETDPTDVILRPNPSGELVEICVLRANPAL